MHLNISVFEQTLPSTLKFHYNVDGHTTEVPNGIIKVPLLAERGNAVLLFSFLRNFSCFSTSPWGIQHILRWIGRIRHISPRLEESLNSHLLDWFPSGSVNQVNPRIQMLLSTKLTGWVLPILGKFNSLSGGTCSEESTCLRSPSGVPSLVKSKYSLCFDYRFFFGTLHI